MLYEHVHLLLTPVSLGVSDGDVDQLGDAIFPFCYDGSYLRVRLLKSIVSGGHDKPLDFCHLSRIMVVEQLDVADVRGISTGADDRGASHDLRRTEGLCGCGR